MQLNAAWQKLCECLELSEYEAKVYVSLFETGATTAGTLSVFSGVPRTKVYSVLKRLVDMGLVVEVPGTPRKFAPNPPKIALKSYLDSYQSMVTNLLSVISCLDELSKNRRTGKACSEPLYGFC